MNILGKITPLLFLITIVLLLSTETLLSREITLSPENIKYFEVYTDSRSGGNTTSEIINSHPIFEWRCKMINSPLDYPFCSYQVILRQNDDWKNGLDLSLFHTFKLWLEYEGNATSLRLFIRNYSTDFGSTDDFTSTKYNSLDVNVDHLQDGLTFNFSNFNVPDWWQRERNLAPIFMSPDFSNVVSLDIQTGSSVKAGTHHFKFKKIELHGQWISTENWYFGILVFWIIFIFIRSLRSQFSLRAKIQSSEERASQLSELNQHLDTKSKKLLKKSITDPLTNAYNRAGAVQYIKAAQDELKSKDLSFSIIFLDIDHFKSINDTYGHDAGDKVLIELSALMQKNIRVSDVFIRWGGEEFVILCRNTQINEAKAIAEKLKELISTSIHIGDILVTSSFGVVEVNDTSETAIDDAFKAVDIALYEAKSTGRNRVVIGNPIAKN